MKSIKEQIHAQKALGKVIPTSSMDELSEIMDEMLADMKEYHPAKYWEYLREVHEAINGPHYNEEYARYDVSQMHHKDAAGKVVEGEHWGIGDARAVFTKWKAKLPIDTTDYDVYVIINATYHDMITVKLAMGKTQEEAENEIIEEGITFYLLDADAVPNKLWEYMEHIPNRK